MDALDIYNIIRKLAKDSYSQQDYTFLKELRIPFFKNNRELSSIQRTYISYLMFYANLNMDVALGDAPEKIFECEIFEDAYSTFKRNESVKRTKKQKKELDEPPTLNSKGQPQTKAERSIGWVFK